jgi:hypothetical protein
MRNRKTNRHKIKTANRIPDFLYRYRGVSYEHSFHELTTGELYFPSPKDFNDPFDCHNLFSFDGATDSHWKNFFKIVFEVNEPNSTALEMDEKIDKIIRSGRTRDKETLDGLWEEWDCTLGGHNNEYGIVCLSKKPNDILMWSHYAEKHKGYCLKFNTLLLANAFSCYDVKYRRNYPRIKECSGLNEMADIFMTSKSNHWEYEEEVRLLMPPSNGGRSHKFPPEALEGVTFGCNMEETNKDNIRQLLNDKGYCNLPIFQASKSKKSYSLEIMPI